MTSGSSRARTSTATLTADLGNSRCKLDLWDAGAGSPRASLALASAELDGPDEPGLAAWLAASGGAQRALVCSVAAPEREAALVAALERLVGAGRVASPDPALANACRTPERTGRDRLFAARAALDRCGSSCVVVDAGTALTVDAVLADASGERFLGGAIAPGPALLARALAQGGAQLQATAPRPGDRALGRDTEEALRAGVAVGFRGSARELVRRVAAEAGIERAPVVLTGGAAAFLLEPEPFVEELFVDPWLVPRGLLAADARARARAR